MDHSRIVGTRGQAPGDIGMPKGTAPRLAHFVGWLVGLALFIALLAAAEIWRSYLAATGAAERTVVSLVRLLAEQTERTIQAIDFTLIGMREALRVSPTLAPDDPAYRAGLIERLGDLPYVRALFVVGADGFIIHDTDYPTTPRTSLADRPYFRVHRENPVHGLYIGQSTPSGSVDVRLAIFSRRITNADGSFGGIVVAAVEPRYFDRLYEDLPIGEGGFIVLLLGDGALAARTPHCEGTVGNSFAHSRLYERALARRDGVEWSRSPLDGTRGIVGYRTVAGGPVVVLAGLHETSVYDSWDAHVAVVGGYSLLVWVLASWLGFLWIKSRRRERMERGRLGQVQRLEMMGRIAGGIAHDLGNTIKIARTTFTLLKPSLTSQQDAMALVDDADRSLKSAFDIIDHLLAFARRRELSPRPTDLAELISGFAPILRQAAGPHIELELDLAGPLVCLIDPIHLESALLNLVLNSRDAMPDGGRISVALREAPHQRRKRAARRGGEAARWAEIVVADNGSGMSREVQERAFEPFFTTRTGGSGLGLSQVLGFVQQSAGDIRVESREGIGTAVTLVFPVRESVTGDP